ncbi:MAG TPA: response regulator, partial [Azospirillaceae bacterium]|nr:response regulator [Azospirillaceae bacterium]
MRVYARQLNQHLPYLRRYARALTGSTMDGDDLVTRCVEAAMLAPSRFGIEHSRAPLYALLHLLFDTEGEGNPAPSPHPIERALSSLPEPQRRLYLLSVLERLPIPEAARVMGLEPSVAVETLGQARDAVRERLTARVMVVEDNPIIALDIQSVIAAMGHEICGTATCARDALDLAERLKPTLALMDIRLSDGDSGIKIAHQLREERGLKVIFVTAFAGELEKR